MNKQNGNKVVDTETKWTAARRRHIRGLAEEGEGTGKYKPPVTVSGTYAQQRRYR